MYGGAETIVGTVAVWGYRDCYEDADTVMGTLWQLLGQWLYLKFINCISFFRKATCYRGGRPYPKHLYTILCMIHSHGGQCFIWGWGLI